MALVRPELQLEGFTISTAPVKSRRESNIQKVHSLLTRTISPEGYSVTGMARGVGFLIISLDV